MREPTRVRVCAVVMSLVAGVLLPMHALAQGGYGPTSTPAPQQDQPPPPEPAQESKRAEARPTGPNPWAIAFDLVMVRPVGLMAVAIGAVLFLPVALITAPMGRDAIETAKETFISVPANDVFKRPLGRF